MSVSYLGMSYMWREGGNRHCCAVSDVLALTLLKPVPRSKPASAIARRLE